METERCVELICRRLPNLEVRDVRGHDDGMENFVVEINGELMFRFPRDHATLATQQNEIAILPLLAPRLSFDLPHYDRVEWSEDGARVLFFSYRKVPGVALTPERILRLDTARLARQLARLLDELASFPVEAALAAGIPRMSVPVRWFLALYIFRRYRRKVAHRLQPEARTRANRFWQRFLFQPRNFVANKPVLAHLDLCPSHVLVDEATSTLTGVIDWSTVEIADPVLDLARLIRWHGFDVGYQIHQATRCANDQVFWRQAVFVAIFVISSVRDWRVLELIEPDGRIRVS